MKRVVAILICITAAFLGTFSALADSYSVDNGNITANSPPDYSVITKDNIKKMTETVERLGYSVESLKNHMNKNNILLIAVNNENTTQFQLKFSKTDFSNNVETLSGLEQSTLDEIGQKLFLSHYDIKTINKTVYYVYKSENTEYDSIQYITIANGKIYTLVCYVADDNEAYSFASGLKIKSKKAITLFSGASILQMVLFIIIFVIALAGVVFIIYTLVRDYYNKKKQNEFTQVIKIKRRKM